MAPPSLHQSLLWGLTLFICGAAASVCNVTCSTDYVKVLNCSCSDSVPAHPVLINVTCWSYDSSSGGSCEVKPPLSWCTITGDLTLVASSDTMCNSTASRPGREEFVDLSDKTRWLLGAVVKLDPPTNVKVANSTNLGVNITWNNNNIEICVKNKLRIRNTEDSFQTPVYVDVQGVEHFELDKERLKPRASYVVDVQAKFCPGEYLAGPWSEWSSGAEWSTEEGLSEGSPNIKAFPGINTYWLYISTPIIVVLALLLLGYLQKPCSQKKLRMITYIPKPNDYFKPLYQNHEGNFKEWVNSGFSENDLLWMNTCVLKNETSKILNWSAEKQGYREDNEVKGSVDFDAAPQLPGILPVTYQNSGTVHSTGHISINTVTLSGEEFEEEVTSQSSFRSYQDGVSFGSLDDTDREHASYSLGEPPASQAERRSLLSLRENQIANDLIMENQNLLPDGDFIEAERASLNSFESNEHSDDGYPHVDLDTIDSGFGECSSPGASDSNSNSFPEDKHLNSNYVKQWMICSTIQEEASNVNNELNETQ